MEQIRDIFISYKNDNAGNNFASRLTADLEHAGYGVYFNSHQQKGGTFPERLRDGIKRCTDFVLIVSQGCLDQLKKHEKIDWIREEIVTAYTNGKHIIPIILENVTMPSDESEWPEDLKFLADIDYIFFTENYTISPFLKFQTFLHSKKEKDDIFRSAFNNNPDYNVYEAYKMAVSEANNGSIEAAYKAGVMCFYGNVSDDGTKSERNYEEAAKYFTMIIENCKNDNPDPESRSVYQYYVNSAHYFLAKMYYAGSIPREGQSYFKAFEHRKEGEADLGNAIQVAYMQREGLGCEYNYTNVIEYYNSVVLVGDDISKGAYAQYLYKIGKFKDAIKIFEAMQHLSADAAYYLGIMYRDGVHTFVDSEDTTKAVAPQPDYYKASYYLQEAADRNHAAAAFELALLNFRPFENYRKNFPKALRYFNIAADRRNSEAQYMLGYMYENGHVGINKDRAIEWYEKAASQHHALASLQLSLLYQQPECKNYHKAYQHALKASNSGVVEAEYILGTLLLFGRGCRCNVNEAYRHFQNAEAQGIFQAKMMLDEINDIKNKKC